MGIDDTLVQEIVQRTLAVARVERIIVFGSAATGQMTRNSDIDLLVLEPAKPASREERVKIRKALRGLGYPFDVFVMSTEEYEASKDLIGGIAHPACQHGKVIYEAA